MQKKDIIQLAITGVLIIALIFLAIKTFSKKRQIPPPIQPKISKNGTTVTDILGIGKGLFTRLEEEAKGLELKRDPFFKQEHRVGPTLEGVVWDSNSPRAVVNGEVVEVGSQIRGYTIMDIQKDSVILKGHIRNDRIQLKLFE